MKTVPCKHEVHQMHQEADTRYELALSVIRSLMGDLNEGSSQVLQTTNPDTPIPDFFKGMGKIDLYCDLEYKLRQWEMALCQQAGIPLPKHEEDFS